MDTVKIQAMKNGPFIVSGEVEILDSQGEKMDTKNKNKALLCRCGQSLNKLFCDGTHKKVNFKSVCVRNMSDLNPDPASSRLRRPA